MCGITGIFHLNGVADEATKGRVQTMTDQVAHRGPDAEGVYRHGPVCLGHRRLAIIDLDARSDQPFTDASGRYTLVFNGQIYNFAEIKAQLADYPFRTT
jgi:asparagine synthase (glutamine-hydrolysing)